MSISILEYQGLSSCVVRASKVGCIGHDRLEQGFRTDCLMMQDPGYGHEGVLVRLCDDLPMQREGSSARSATCPVGPRTRSSGSCRPGRVQGRSERLLSRWDCQHDG